MPKANEMVQWTISSDERRELKRAAAVASLKVREAFFDPLTPHLKNQWVERRYRAANPMIFLPLPQGERDVGSNGSYRVTSNPN